MRITFKIVVFYMWFIASNTWPIQALLSYIQNNTLCNIKDDSSCNTTIEGMVSISKVRPLRPSDPLDSLDPDVFDWLKDFLGTRSMTGKIKDALKNNKATLFRALLHRKLRTNGFHKVVIKGLEDFKTEKMKRLIKNKRNTFVTRDRLIIIYYEKEHKSWYMQQYDPKLFSQSLLLGKKVALSSCMNAIHGRTGYVSSMYKASIHLDGSIQLPSDFINPSNHNVILALSGQVQSGGSFKISGTVTCNFDTGYFAQPYMYPLYIQIPEGNRIRVKHHSSKGIVTKGEWEKTPSFSRLAAAAPLVECHVDNSSLVCDAGPKKGLRMGDLKKIIDNQGKNDITPKPR